MHQHNKPTGHGLMHSSKKRAACVLKIAKSHRFACKTAQGILALESVIYPIGRGPRGLTRRGWGGKQDRLQTSAECGRLRGSYFPSRTGVLSNIGHALNRWRPTRAITVTSAGLFLSVSPRKCVGEIGLNYLQFGGSGLSAFRRHRLHDIGPFLR